MPNRLASFLGISEIKLTKILFVGIFLLATILRFINLGKHGMAGDEMYSMLVSNFISQEGGNQPEFRKTSSPYFTNKELAQKKNWSDFLVSVAKRDNGSGALYALLSHYWQKITGKSDGAIRSLPLIFNLLTLVLLFYFVKKYFKSDNLALISSFLFTISPLMISYSQVNRTYTLMFLIALLSTYILLAFLQNQKNILSLIVYGVLVFLALMSHYAVFVIFLLHGIYVLFYYRNFKTIILLIASMLIPALGMIWWLNSPGGQWAFHSIEVSKVVYNQIALNGSDPLIQTSTLPHILKQLWKVISMSFVFSDGFAFKLLGKTNMIISAASLAAGIILYQFLRKKSYFIWLVMAVLILPYFFYSINPFNFICFNFLSLSLYIAFLEKKLSHSKEIFLVFLIGTGSIILLVLFAKMDGNTFRIIPRYAAYGYTFGCILSGIFISWIFSSGSKSLKMVFSIFLILQLVQISKIIYNIYQDRAYPYFHVLSEPRVENPYRASAENIFKNYAVGDTVLMPSFRYDINESGYDMPEYSVQDAQYINLYLTETPKTIIQRVDTTENNKVFLQKKSGNKILIYDFEDGRYRY